MKSSWGAVALQAGEPWAVMVCLLPKPEKGVLWPMPGYLKMFYEAGSGGSHL